MCAHHHKLHVLGDGSGFERPSNEQTPRQAKACLRMPPYFRGIQGVGAGILFPEKSSAVNFAWGLFRQTLKKSVENFATVPPEALSWTQEVVTPNLPKTALTLPLVLCIATRSTSAKSLCPGTSAKASFLAPAQKPLSSHHRGGPFRGDTNNVITKM